MRPDMVVAVDPGLHGVASLGGGMVGRAWAHSRKDVRIRHSALPLVRGVSGRVRIWRSPAGAQAVRKAWLR
jgi:hypothetical protein